MTEKKYELLKDDTVEAPDGTTLYRIRALRDIGEIAKAGDLGGYVMHENSLSHKGDAWVSDNAQVSGNAWVSEDAWVSWVSDNAQVSEDAWVSDNARVSSPLSKKHTAQAASSTNTPCIEAATVAWHPLGWEPVAFSEIEPFPCAVLKRHYPNVPNLGNVTQITEEQIADLGHIDLVVGGSPCQNLSIAGNRKGLAGEASGLFHEQIRIFDAARKHCGARWLVWENVPGAFSSNKGADFAQVVGALAGCELSVPAKGWRTEGVALGDKGLMEWAVLDAQFFGVAQRRKRVFAVVDTGDWQNRPPVLLERDSLRGDRPTRGQATQKSAEAINAGVFAWDDAARFIEKIMREEDGCEYVPEVAMCLNAGGMGRRDAETETFVVHGSQDPIVSIELAHTLGRNQGQENVVYSFDYQNNNPSAGYEDIAPTLLTFGGKGRLAILADKGRYSAGIPRRLTPLECERLQGFPDNYTAIPWRGKPAEQCADGPRYKTLGNSMAVPVMRWVGRKIEAATNK